MGRTNPGTSSDTQQQILRKLFKVNVHSVAGYAGSAEGFIAVERGELEGGCMTWASLPPAGSRAEDHADHARDVGDRARSARQRAERARPPQRRPRPKVLRVLSAAGEVGKPLVAHLSVPDDRVQILREAFAAMVRDPQFLADAGEDAPAREPDTRPTRRRKSSTRSTPRRLTSSRPRARSRTIEALPARHAQSVPTMTHFMNAGAAARRVPRA